MWNSGITSGARSESQDLRLNFHSVICPFGIITCTLLQTMMNLLVINLCALYGTSMPYFGNRSCQASRLRCIFVHGMTDFIGILLVLAWLTDQKRVTIICLILPNPPVLNGIWFFREGLTEYGNWQLNQLYFLDLLLIFGKFFLLLIHF